MTDSNPRLSQLLDARCNSLASVIISEYYRQYPDLEARYGEAGKVHCIQDTLYHLTYLSEAIAAGHPRANALK